MGNQCSPYHHSSQAHYVVKIRKGASYEEIESLLQATACHSDDVDWDKAVQQARELHNQQKLELKRELEAQLELRQILKLRKDLDKQGSFSTNLLSCLTVRQDLLNQKEPDEAGSVSTSCSSMQDDK